MSDELYAFKVGDRVVLARLGPDQPEGVVTGINAARTFPSLYTVSVVFEPGKAFCIAPSGLRPASEKAGLPIVRPVVEPTLPFSTTPCVRSPILAPEWDAENISEAALAKAVEDWERSVKYIESGFDYREDIEEYQLDVFAREEVHGILLGFASLNMSVPDALAARIASADQRYLDLTEASHSIWGAWDYNPTAFWYYFRWPRSR